MINKLKHLSKTNKILLINTIMAFGVRGIGLVVSLYTFPVYMDFFSDQKVLGLWFTMLSLLTWVLTFDLGIGNGLRNKLVQPLVEHDFNKAKILITSAYTVSGIIVVIGFLSGLIIFPMIDWNSVFNISANLISPEALLKTLMILYSGVLIQFLLKIINSIFYALQISVLPNMLALLSNTLLLVYVLLVNRVDLEGNLLMLARANIYFTNLPLLVASIIVFKTKLKHCAPNPKYYNKKSAISVMSLGLTFFWLQLMSLVLTSTNEFIITWLSGPQDVVNYQIYFKLFSLVGTIFTLSMIPIWSAITKAHYEKNYEWIAKIFNLLKILAFIFVTGEFVLILILQPIVNFWLGENAIEINYLIAFIFAVSGGLYIWHSAITSVVNGIGRLKIQIIFLTIGGLINIPIAFLLFSVSGNWISIVIANIISLLPYCVIQPFFISKYLNNERRY